MLLYQSGIVGQVSVPYVCFTMRPEAAAHLWIRAGQQGWGWVVGGGGGLTGRGHNDPHWTLSGLAHTWLISSSGHLLVNSVSHIPFDPCLITAGNSMLFGNDRQLHWTTVWVNGHICQPPIWHRTHGKSVSMNLL